jgi:hypothetical protein
MWKNATIATALTMLLIGTVIFCNMDFLVKYKRLLWREHGQQMAVFALLLAVNLYGIYFLLTTKVLLKPTGTKLRHVDKQLHDGNMSVAQELQARLSEE